MTDRRSRWRRLLWFGALWLGGVVALAVVAGLLRLLIRAAS
jgi:hypothetical protein